MKNIFRKPRPASKPRQSITFEEIADAQSALEQRYVVRLDGHPRGMITRFKLEPGFTHPWKAWAPRGLGGRFLDAHFGPDGRERAVQSVINCQ